MKISFCQLCTNQCWNLQLFRFRCKYPACQVQHYRKDQMENHQSKVHGAINPMLIEDRTAELFKISQVNFC